MPISVIKDFTFSEKCEHYKSEEDNHVIILPCTLGFISGVTVNARKSYARTFAKDAISKTNSVIIKSGQAFIFLELYQN